MAERCEICDCPLIRKAGAYALSTTEGRSHATRHHYVAERFFGRSANRKGKYAEKVFQKCPWEHEGKTGIFCYECHELLLHNPVLLPKDIQLLALLVKQRGLNEKRKPAGHSKLGGRIELLHEAIARGLRSLVREQKRRGRTSG